MITLRELVLRQAITEESDGDLISEWFFQNNMAIEGMDIVYKLARKKIENDIHTQNNLLGDLYCYNITPQLISEYKKDASKLNLIITRFIICKRLGRDFESEYPNYMEWLREVIPQHKIPHIFWRDFYDFLVEKGIVKLENAE